MRHVRVLAACLLVTILLTSACTVTYQAPGSEGTTSGSGNLVTKEYPFQNFSRLQAGFGFTLEVTQGSTYSVAVTADANSAPYLDVTQQGQTVNIGLQGGRSYRNTTLRAKVTMPALSGMDLSSGTRSTGVGFASSEAVALQLSGGSRLTLQGSGKSLTLQASGGSSFDLSQFPVTTATVEMSGGSTGTVNVQAGALNVTASGGSRLSYTGNPSGGNRSTSGGSSVQPK